ncbi:hypothetical protein MalM25_05300 [Planctomycetes bacterium MalM25]|nr:hypothetical protein MalM25_05300 [Planctomycetes bacterium MalM25]
MGVYKFIVGAALCCLGCSDSPPALEADRHGHHHLHASDVGHEHQHQEFAAGAHTHEHAHPEDVPPDEPPSR